MYAQISVNMQCWLINIFIILGSLFPLPVYSSDSVSEQFASATKSFQVQFEQVDRNTIFVHFRVLPGYTLYKNRLRATYNGRALAISLLSIKKTDTSPKGSVDAVTLKLYSQAGFKSGDRVYLTWQGCGPNICFAPQAVQFTIGGANASSFIETLKTALLNSKEGSPYQEVSLSIKGLISLFFFYIAGLGLAFTGCVYPLLPIVSAFIIRKARSQQRAFMLSFVYVQAMALIYAILGMLAAYTEQWLAAYFPQQWLLIGLATFFITMAMAMLGVFQFQVPPKLQSWLARKTQKLRADNYLSAGLLGALSSMIIGPCVAPPLAAALAYLSKEGNPILGGAILYMLALGMGTPILLIGALGQRLLPRVSPKVMKAIQLIISCILLGSAIWVLNPIISVVWQTVLIVLALLGITRAVAWRYKNLGYPFILGIGGIIASVAIYMKDLLPQSISISKTELTRMPQKQHTINIESKQHLQKQLAIYQGHMVLLEFYADWCRACQQMEVKTLQNPSVQQVIKNWRVFKVDLSKNSAAKQKLLHDFNLYGPPAILFFDKQGNLLPNRIIGYQDIQGFLKVAAQVLQNEKG